MTGNQVLRHTHRATYSTNLILEQPLQWLAQLKVHLLRKTTYIVMALDYLTSDVQTLDTVWIDSTLSQPLGTSLLLSLSIENLHEVAADNLTLLLRICNTSQIIEELLRSINTNHVQAQALVILHYITELILSEHTVIYEDTGEVLADSLVQENSSYAGINTTRKAQDNLVIAQLCLQLSYSSFNERVSTPVLLTTADIYHEILQELCTLQRMEHLWVELYSPNRLLGRSISSILHIGSRSDALIVLRNSCDGIAMTHPNLRVLDESLEQWILLVELLQVSTTILTAVSSLHLTALSVREELSTVADTEHRDATDKLAQIYLESFRIMNGIRATAQNDTNDRWVILWKLVVRHNLAEGIKLTNTTANQLCGL